MTIEELRKKLASVDELPALPTIITEINTLLSNPRTTAAELSRVIMRDPAITAKILKIVNSSFFGLPKRISSVNQSIIVLGFNTVRSIALCSSIIESLGKGSANSKLNYKEFWQFSVGVGSAARVVARNAGEKKTEPPFVAGLLHGVGKIVLDRFFRDDYIKSFQIAKEREITLYEAERVVFGLSDAQVGAVLLELWKLNPDLVGAVMYQDNPAQGKDFAVGAAYNMIGSVLARLLRLGEPGDYHLPRISQEVMALAKIEPAQWPRLIELTADEAKRASVFYEM